MDDGDRDRTTAQKNTVSNSTTRAGRELHETQAITSAPAAFSSSCRATNDGKCFSLFLYARLGSTLASMESAEDPQAKANKIEDAKPARRSEGAR